MANPIFGRGEGFTKYSQPQGHPQAGYGQGGPTMTAPQYQQYEQYQGYEQQPQYAPQQGKGGVMTYDDVIAKTGLSLGAVFLVAAAVFMGFARGVLPIEMLWPLSIAGMIGSIVTVFVVAFKHKIGPVGLGVYALFEGLLIGAISALFEVLYPGIVLNAVLATFVTAAVTLAVMKFGKIRVTSKFRRMVTIATMAFFGVVVVNFILALFGIHTGIRAIGGDAGFLAIGVSILAICLAVFNLVMDFDAVRVGVERRAPASESWRAALGITVTMVWLYVEILRVMSYFRD